MITRKRAYMRSGENKAIQYNIVLLISLQLKSYVDTTFSQGEQRKKSLLESVEKDDLFSTPDLAA